MKLSQGALGAKVSRSHSQISNIERGLVANPPAELLTSLAIELGEDPEEYLRLAGRVALTAAQVVPGEVPQAALIKAVTEAVRDTLMADQELWAKALARALVVALQDAGVAIRSDGR